MTATLSRDRTGTRPANLVLAAVLAGAFMSLLDTTIVNVALPSIQHALHASDSALEWIVSGYALAFGLTLIPAGRLGDAVGRKPLYLGGLVLFLLASLLAGLSRSAGELVAARIIQGAGAGVFYTQINATIVDTFAGPARRKAFGVLGAFIGLSTAAGPLAGGLLITAAGDQNGWRWVFLVNLAIGLVAVPAAIRFLPAPVRRSRQRTDQVGIGLLTAALLLVLFPLIEGQADGWPPWTYLCFAAAIPTLAGLAGWERRLEGSGGTPLIPPALVRRASFSAGALFALIYFAAFTSIFCTLSITWQEGFGHGALAAGLVISPFAAGSIIGAANSSRVTARLGRTVLTVGCVGVIAGFAALLALFHFAATVPGGWDLAGPLFGIGVGNGLIIAPNASFVLSAVPPADNGAASGVLNTAQRAGGAIGVALVATVLFDALHIDGRGPAAVAAGFSHAFQIATLVNLLLVVAALIAALASRPAAAAQPASRPEVGHADAAAAR